MIQQRSRRFWLAAVLLIVAAIGWTVERRGQERKLLGAATAGDVVTVSALLGRGIGPDARERNDGSEFQPRSRTYYATRWQTPLHAAAFSGGGEVAGRLVRAGANVNAVTASGHTPLMVAAEWQGVEVVRQLLAAGADPNRREIELGGSALHIAARRGDVAIVRALLDAGAAVDVANQSGATPLRLAVEARQLEVVKLLAARGASVHVRDGEPPFHVAAGQGDLAIARVLLAHGADPGASWGANTSLQNAAGSRRWRMVRLIRQAEKEYAASGLASRKPRLPKPWKRPPIGIANWDDLAERLALNVGLPLVLCYLDFWLLRRMWREDGLAWLKGAEAFLPLRGRWLRMLLTAVLLILTVPLCCYTCLLVFFFFQWLGSLS